MNEILIQGLAIYEAKGLLTGRLNDLQDSWSTKFPNDTVVAGPWLNYLLIHGHMPGMHDPIPNMFIYTGRPLFRDASDSRKADVQMDVVKFDPSLGWSAYRLNHRIGGNNPYNIVWHYNIDWKNFDKSVLDAFFWKYYSYYRYDTDKLYISPAMQDAIHNMPLNEKYFFGAN